MYDEGRDRTLIVCRKFTTGSKRYTTRSLAKELGISKSSVFYHLKLKAYEVCPELVPQINERLLLNKELSASLGGKASARNRRNRNEQRKVIKFDE